MKSQQEYWDKVSEEKEFTTLPDFSLFDKHVNHSAFIVDYGCGYGRTLEQLWQKGYQNTLGFDFSERMIQRGKNQYPHLNLKTSQSNQISCKSNSVDMVILFAVLTCIIRDDEQIKLINEVIRVLKPGGLIYINDFLLNDDNRNRERYSKYSGKYKTYGVFELPEGAVLRHHNKQWIETLISEFKKLTYKEITFKTMNGHHSNGFMYVGKTE